MLITSIVWITGVLMILLALDIQITPLIASLWVWWIAIWFALQSILSDIFSSFSIYFDKPFAIGDLVVIGEDSWIVQDITLKSTRIKTLNGQMLVIPNTDVTSSRVQNFADVKRRRTVLTLGLLYETSPEKLKALPWQLEALVAAEDLAVFDRAHFRAYWPSSLDFELVYFVDTLSFKQFLDINQVINFAIFDLFAREWLEFAYPTQTIYRK